MTGIWFGPTTVRLTEVKIEIGKVVSSLSAALAEIKSGQLKVSVAARAYNIPETTLRRYLKLSDGKFPVNGGYFRMIWKIC